LVSPLTHFVGAATEGSNFNAGSPCATARRPPRDYGGPGRPRKGFGRMIEEERPLPPVLAEQAELLRAQFDADDPPPPDILRRQVDAAVFNLCEYAEADMALLNRIMALRAAAESLAQGLEDAEACDPEDARARAMTELAALEAVLRQSRPSQVSRAMGLDW
jgi:hypothetical protein